VGFRVVCVEFYESYASVVFVFDDAFLFEYLEVAVYLVVGAVDDADEVRHVSRLCLG